MSAIETRISRFEAALLTALLVILICLPLCKQLIFVEPGTETIEGRPLSPLPEFSFKRGLRDFPINFEAYYNDHFGFRAVLLRLGGYLGVKYANVSLSPDVIIGKEGWLFEKSGLSQDTYHGGPIFSNAELEQWKRSLEYRQQWLAKRGIQFLFVVPPDKQTVYPEFMPDKYNGLLAQTPAQQLLGYLSAHSNVHVLSLIGPLMKAKEEGGDRLYLRQDTHWNTLGAFVGYREIMDRLHEWFPGLKPKGRSQFRTVKEYEKGDLARMMGMPDYSAGYEKTLAPVAAPLPLLPIPFKVEGLKLQPGDRRFLTQLSGATSGTRVVMLHDSYTWMLVPFMAGDFMHITYLLRGGDDNAEFEKALGDLVRREKPDIFIEERLERFLQEAPPDEKIIFGGDAH